jgi:hypothetical protein
LKITESELTDVYLEKNATNLARVMLK